MLNSSYLSANSIDYEATLERFCGREDHFEKYLLEFKENYSLKKLEKAIQNEDIGSAFFSAHDLKGTSGNLGMTNLYKSSCKLTELLRNIQHPDMVRIKSTFTELQNDYKKIIEVLEKGITQ